MKGTRRRFGKFSLGNLLPFAGLGRGGMGRGPRRKWLRSRWREEPVLADRLAPERNVLDYRALDGLRLVSGDIYADH